MSLRNSRNALRLLTNNLLIKLNAMKGNLAIMIWILIAGTVASAQPGDININGLIGKVKSFDEQDVTVKEKNGRLVEGVRIPTRRVIFDKQGRMTYEWISINGLTAKEFYYDY